MKNMSEISSNNILLSSHEINSLLKKTVYKQIEKKVNLRYFLFLIFSKSNIQVTFKFTEH